MNCLSQKKVRPFSHEHSLLLASEEQWTTHSKDFIIIMDNIKFERERERIRHTNDRCWQIYDLSCTCVVTVSKKTTEILTYVGEPAHWYQCILKLSFCIVWKLLTLFIYTTFKIGCNIVHFFIRSNSQLNVHVIENNNVNSWFIENRFPLILLLWLWHPPPSFFTTK